MTKNSPATLFGAVVKLKALHVLQHIKHTDANLQCSVVSHWLRPYPELSLLQPIHRNEINFMAYCDAKTVNMICGK